MKGDARELQGVESVIAREYVSPDPVVAAIERRQQIFGAECTHLV
jgi:hypothetical protein